MAEALRALIVGAGLMGRHHARVARQAGAKVVGVVDPNLPVAQKLAGQMGGAAVYEDVAAAVAALKPDVAHLCTPLASHLPIGQLLAGAGVHAMIEKPLAANAGDTADATIAFAQAGLQLCPVHQYAFQSSIEQARTAIPNLGSVRRIAFEIRSAGGGNDPAQLDQIASEIVPHPLSMIQRLTAADVGSLEWSMLRPQPGEWLAIAAHGDLMISIALSLGARPTCFQTAILATGGSLFLDNFHDFLVRGGAEASRFTKMTQPFVQGAQTLVAAGTNLAGRALRGESAYPGLRTLVERFYASIAGTGPAPIGMEEIVGVAQARDTLLTMATPGDHG